MRQESNISCAVAEDVVAHRPDVEDLMRAAVLGTEQLPPVSFVTFQSCFNFNSTRASTSIQLASPGYISWTASDDGMHSPSIGHSRRP